MLRMYACMHVCMHVCSCSEINYSADAPYALVLDTSSTRCATLVTEMKIQIISSK